MSKNQSPELEEDEKALIEKDKEDLSIQDHQNELTRTLDQLQRKIDLDRLVLNWSQDYRKAKSPSQWIRLLNKISDDNLKEMCGSD